MEPPRRKGFNTFFDAPAGVAATADSTPRKVWCSVVGCEQPAAFLVRGRNLCRGCDTRIRNEEAAEYCRTRGLNTREDMRADVVRKAREFGTAPKFEAWLRVITQGTVDGLLLNGDEHTLKRLREACAIDEHDRLIPIEQREAVRASRDAARTADRERIEAELAARGAVAVPGEEGAPA